MVGDELSSHAEGTTAPAGALHVRIVELETRAFERLDVVDLDAIEVHGTHLVDGDLEAIEIHNLVRLVGLVFKRHVVLETRAAATDNRDAQRRRDGVLHIHDFLDLIGRNAR